MKNEKKIGLSLSGGGYRAAAFHLGTLKKLKELDLLDKIDVISTISGGSIIGAYYVLNKDCPDALENFSQLLKESLIKKIVTSTRVVLILLSILISCLILGYLLPLGWFLFAVLLIIIFLLLFFHNIFKTTKLMQIIYDEVFFEEKKIDNLPGSPTLAINTTNLDTGTLWTFSKDKIGDSSYVYPKDCGEKISFNNLAKMRISEAVSASTAVPYFFNPLKIDDKYFKNATDIKRATPLLLDGGIYDNQGIHKITQKNSTYKCEIIITSDASAPISRTFTRINPFPILKRVVDLQMLRIKNMQFINNVLKKDCDIYEIAYYSLDWKYDLCITGFLNALRKNEISASIVQSLNISQDMFAKEFPQDALIEHLKKKIGYENIIKNCLSEQEIEKIKTISTNLTALTDDEIELLSRHAQVLTEIQLRLYCPSLFGEFIPVPSSSQSLFSDHPAQIPASSPPQE